MSINFHVCVHRCTFWLQTKFPCFLDASKFLDFKKNFSCFNRKTKKREPTPDRLGSCWISISSFRMINGYFVVMLHWVRIDNLCTICSRMPSAFLLRDARHTTHDIFFCASLQLYTPFRSVLNECHRHSEPLWLHRNPKGNPLERLAKPWVLLTL